MHLFDSLLLGIIQGLTEFIPVSSTAHLLIAQYLLGLPADDFAFAFNVLVQLGTLLALIVYFWRDWIALIRLVADIRASILDGTFESRVPAWLDQWRSNAQRSEKGVINQE